jgi:hypothetical protein
MPKTIQVGIGLLALAALLGCDLVSAASPAASLASPTAAPTIAPATDTPLQPTSLPEPTTPVPHADWLVYRNDGFGFELRYPPEGMVVVDEEQTARIDLPYASGTNLREKYLQVDASRGTSACADPLAAGWEPGSLPTETRDLGGLSFTVQTGTEGAAGNFYEWTGYTTARGDVCVSLSYVLHSTNAMNYTPPLAEFDAAAERAVFEEITRTFSWTAP